MKHWHLGLLAAVAAFFITSSAQAAPDFRVIQWDFTRICQIYDFGSDPLQLQGVDPAFAQLPRSRTREGPAGASRPLLDLTIP